MLKKMPKKMPIFFDCEICVFRCSKKSNYDAHILTRKHSFNTKNAVSSDTVNCINCNKNYKTRTGLWYHMKSCGSNDSVLKELSETESLKILVTEVIKNNSELQKQNIELHKKIIDVCSNNASSNVTNIQNNNKTFNLNFFLNEKCKDAMNISEFADTFNIQFSELESVGELGYIDGITKIIVGRLKDMDIYRRPVHCSDTKRETIYIKDENKWEKENTDTPKLRQAIKNVSFKNMKLVSEWSEANPDSKLIDTKLNDKYMNLIKQSTGGSGDILENEDKIIRRIAKELVIDKYD